MANGGGRKILMDKDRFFEQLYDEYYNQIYHYLCYKVQNTANAEDLANDTFMLVYKNIHIYDETKGMAVTWIFAIANNRLKNYYRSRKSMEYSYDSFESVPAEMLYDKNDCIAQKELSIVLEQMLAQLPQRNRQIIKMKYYDNMTSVEIGRRLQISSENVRVILKRSLSKMKKISYGLAA